MDVNTCDRVIADVCVFTHQYCNILNQKRFFSFNMNMMKHGALDFALFLFTDTWKPRTCTHNRDDDDDHGCVHVEKCRLLYINIYSEAEQKHLRHSYCQSFFLFFSCCFSHWDIERVSVDLLLFLLFSPPT